MNEKLAVFMEKYSSWAKQEVDEYTRLEEDLCIYGEDAEFLFGEYMEVFNVDLSNFDIDKYFTPQLGLCPPYWFWFSYTLFRRYSKHYKEKSYLTVGDLDRGIQYGRLDEEIIAMRPSHDYE